VLAETCHILESSHPTPLSSNIVLVAINFRHRRQLLTPRLWYLMLVSIRWHARIAGQLLCDTLVSVEAVLELFAVLVGGVVGEHLAARGALKGLEARLALDRLGGDVLV
jgi:hypothetical protein